MGESIAEFMDRQRRRFSRFGREAEAAAHEAYREAIRAGQELRLTSPGEVMRHGMDRLEQLERRAKSEVSSRGRSVRSQAAKVVERVGESPILRPLAVGAAGSAGTLAGVGRGAAHSAQGLVDGGVFALRLANPLDRYMSPPGESAEEQLAEVGRSVADYVGKAINDPQMVVDDVKAKAGRMRVELDPNATPAKPTFAGQLQHTFDTGQNVGELAFDVGAVGVGGPGAKMVKGFGRASNVGNAERYIAQGFTPEAAAHLAQPYPASNMGHHFIPRRTRLGDTAISREYMDGPFNRLAPEDKSRGEFYELHYSVDPKFYGTRVLGERWSGRDLGLPRYGLAGQLWYGSPPPLKARVGGLGAAVGGVGYDMQGGDGER